MGRSVRRNNVSRKTKRKNLSKRTRRKNLSKNLSKRNLSKKNRRKNLSKKNRLYGGMDQSPWREVDTVRVDAPPPPVVHTSAGDDRRQKAKGPTKAQIAAKQRQDGEEVQAIQRSHSASKRSHSASPGLGAAAHRMFGGPTSGPNREADRWAKERAEDLARIANVLRSEFARSAVVDKLNTGFNTVMEYWLAQGITLSEGGAAKMYETIRNGVIAQLKTGRYEFDLEHGSDKKNIKQVHALVQEVKKALNLKQVRVSSSLKKQFTPDLTKIKCLVRVVTDFTEFNNCKDDADKLAGLIQRISGSIVYKYVGGLAAIRGYIKEKVEEEKATEEFDAEEADWAETYLAVTYDAAEEERLAILAEDAFAQATASVVEFMSDIDVDEAADEAADDDLSGDADAGGEGSDDVVPGKEAPVWGFDNLGLNVIALTERVTTIESILDDQGLMPS